MATRVGLLTKRNQIFVEMAFTVQTHQLASVFSAAYDVRFCESFMNTPNRHRGIRLEAKIKKSDTLTSIFTSTLHHGADPPQVPQHLAQVHRRSLAVPRQSGRQAGL
jgi:hypothetical protein